MLTIPEILEKTEVESASDKYIGLRIGTTILTLSLERSWFTTKTLVVGTGPRVPFSYFESKLLFLNARENIVRSPTPADVI